MLKKLPTWYTALSAFGVMAILLYIAYHDEGYNNWSWMQDAGSWVFLFIAWNFLFWTLIGIGITLRTVLKSNSSRNNPPPTS